VGVKSSVIGLGKTLLVAALTASLLSPAAAKPREGKLPKKITVHPQRQWRGYGFLPGYRPQANDLDWRGRGVRYEPLYEWRYWHYGELRYGWGRPGFYRGRWNGGSFGPCWTYTPIGPMWNCQ
jgi:hypothetical protein